MTVEPIRRFCLDNDLPWEEETEAKFEEYLDLLAQFNDSMNLIGPLDRDEIVRELLLDSLAPALVWKPQGRILDVGTGAGLPGIPLKIVFRDRPIVLVEPRRKRSTFLKIATNRLGLEEVVIERARLEELQPDAFDYLISKAFRAPSEWLELAAPFRSASGVIVCMTTREERGSASEKAEQLGLSELAALENVSELSDVDTERAVYVFGEETS